MTPLILTPEAGGERLDAFLARSVEGLTRSAAQRLLEEGAVTSGGRPLKKSEKTAPGQVVEVVLPEPEPVDVLPQNIPLDVVYEDSDVIVVNKPVGMVVHPAPGHPDGTLVNALLYHCGNTLSGINGELRPGIVHRIDRDTSGLIIAASSRTTPWPGCTRRWRWAASGRTRARWTPPSAATLWTGRKWPSSPETGGRR